MKILKIILLSALSILVGIYLAFLFVLPNVVDLNSYAASITKTIEDKSGFQVQIQGLKIKTAWNLSAGALIDKTDLKYPNGKKFAQINDLQVKLSLVPLLFNQLEIDTISAKKLLLNLEIDKNSELLLKKYCRKSATQNLKFSNNMPDIFVNQYRISLMDNNKKYSARGTDLKISDFVLNKKIKLKTNGNLIFNGRRQISYNVVVFSKILPANKGKKFDIMKIFDDLYKYNVNANINTNLKIRNNLDIDGKMNLDKILFTIGGKTFPQSDLKLDFNGSNVKIHSNFYTNDYSKAVVTGFFKGGKHKEIDLKVRADKVSLGNAVFIANNILKIFGKNNLDKINATGYLTANFNMKSNFKKIRSNGYLKIQNANITNKLYDGSLNSVNADIDFSQDAVSIQRAKAKFNSQPITISGTIDKNANADISISADKLLLKSVLFAFGKTKILEENEFLNGFVNVKTIFKGRLDRLTPKTTLLADNIDLKNKKTKARIIVTRAAINSNYIPKRQGTIDIKGLKFFTPTAINISAPTLSLTFNQKDLNIKPSYLYINNIRTDLNGKISGLNSSPIFNPVMINIPNQISVPIIGYSGSNILLKGNLKLVGDLYNPQLQGGLDVPLIQIPSASTVLKNVTLQFGKDLNINCPQIQVANLLMSLDAQIDNNFSKGIVAKNVNFKSNNINLNLLMSLFKAFPNPNQNSNITIVNGKSVIEKFKIGRLESSNITSDISLKNNILHLDNLRSDAYFGKLAGGVSYDLINKKTKLDLQGRGLRANPALIALTGRNNDINGQLDFDNYTSMTGISKNELLNSLAGNTNFIISNGKMGALGKFEHLLYAQNIVSNNVFKASLNVIAKAITVKNTGVYRYMKGKIAFANGWANIDRIKTSGPSMSLYVTGRCYMPDNEASLIVLGRISDDVVRILGPIGEFSVNKAISSIPKIGEITTFLVNQFTTNPIYENISEIPYLSPKTELPTKEFKVIIDGEIQRQSSVKSFKWLARPKVIQTQNNTYISPSKPNISVPDFVKNLPDLQD
ncbi:MAG: AsmA-like C-terminal region-containing protein [bacterium]